MGAARDEESRLVRLFFDLLVLTALLALLVGASMERARDLRWQPLETLEQP